MRLPRTHAHAASMHTIPNTCLSPCCIAVGGFPRSVVCIFLGSRSAILRKCLCLRHVIVGIALAVRIMFTENVCVCVMTLTAQPLLLVSSCSQKITPFNHDLAKFLIASSINIGYVIGTFQQVVIPCMSACMHIYSAQICIEPGIGRNIYSHQPPPSKKSHCMDAGGILSNAEHRIT